MKELDISSVCNTALSNVVMNDFSVLQHFSSVELFLITLRKQSKPKLNLAFLNPSLTFIQEAILFFSVSKCYRKNIILSVVKFISFVL